MKSASLCYAALVLGMWIFEALLRGLWWPATLLIALPHEWQVFPPAVLLALSVVRRSFTSVLVNGASLAWVLLLSCSIAIPLAPGRARQSTGFPVRVTTLNIAGAPDGVPAVRQALEGLGADVVLLQEAYRWNVTDEILPGGAAGWTRVHAGELAILSRLPVLSWQQIEPQVAGSNRGILAATLDAGGRRLNVVTCHLSLLFHGTSIFRDPFQMGPQIDKASRIRREEMDALLKACGESSGPLVVGGDLNAPPRDVEVRRLGRLYVDAFQVGGLGLGRTFDSLTPMVRIDYIMATRDLIVGGCRVTPSLVSDHLPVTAQFGIP